MTKSALTCTPLRGVWGQMDSSAIWVSWSDELTIYTHMSKICIVQAYTRGWDI